MSSHEASLTVEDGLSRALDALPFTRTHLLLVVLVCFGHVFEAIEHTMNAVFSTIYVPDIKAGRIAAWEVGMLIGAAGLGAAVGAPLMGVMSDRWGRRTTLAAALVVVSLFSIAGAMSNDIRLLTATRLLTSFGTGTYVPLSITFLAEVIPQRARGRAVMANAIVAGLGGIFSGLLTAWFNIQRPLGIDGWRSTMILAAIGSLVVAYGLMRMPESPRWMMARGDKAGARDVYRRMAGLDRNAPVPDFDPPVPVPAKGTGTSPATQDDDTLWTPARLRRLAVFLTLSILLPWGLVTFPQLGGAMLANRGYDSQTALVFHSIVVAGIFLGGIANLFVIDRVSRKALLIATTLGCAGSAMLFGITETPLQAMFAGLLFNACVGIVHHVLLLFAAEQFPPLLRGRVPTMCYGVNRGVAMVVPIVVLPLLSNVGEYAVLLLIGSSMTLMALIVATLRVKRET